jgi:hypothetical protein
MTDGFVQQLDRDSDALHRHFFFLFFSGVCALFFFTSGAEMAPLDGDAPVKEGRRGVVRVGASTAGRASAGGFVGVGSVGDVGGLSLFRHAAFTRTEGPLFLPGDARAGTTMGSRDAWMRLEGKARRVRACDEARRLEEKERDERGCCRSSLRVGVRRRALRTGLRDV